MNHKRISILGGFLLIISLVSCTFYIKGETSNQQSSEEPGGSDILEEEGEEVTNGNDLQNCGTLPETNQASDSELIQPGCYTGELGGDLPSGNRDNEDWYTFNVKAGQIITLILTQPENSSITMGLYRPDSKSVGSVSTVGNIRTLEYVADVDGAWWVKIIRSSGGGKFKLEYSLANQDDAGSGMDAGNASEALSITPGDIQGFLKRADDEDWYTFNVDVGQNISLELTQPEETSITMKLYRPNSKSAGSVSTIGNVRTLKYLSDMKGNWFIKILRSSGEGTYSLKLNITNE
jgi:hypothetical protein